MAFKTIREFPRYEINENGEIWRKERIGYNGKLLERKQLKPTICKNGYPTVRLFDGHGVGKQQYVHRIVWEAFHDKIPKGLEICHEDCDRTNCKLSNLRLGTHAENCRNVKSLEHYRKANSLDKGKFDRHKLEAAKSKEHEESLKSQYIIIWLNKGSAVGVYEFMQKAHVGYPRAVRITKEMQGKLKNMGASIN